MISIIVVTHNSQDYLCKLLENIDQCHELIIVDSGSTSTIYLENAQRIHHFKLILRENVGFSRANNIGFQHASADSKYIAFVNPDLFLKKGWLECAEEFMSKPENEDVAVFSSALERYDIKFERPTGLYDSLGITQKLFWKDIGQGAKVINQWPEPAIVEREAICGALMFCRRSALDAVSPRGDVFWEKLYMYKEDIELSLRLRKFGYRLCIDLNSINYHCRGWKERQLVPRWAKLISAKNDVLVAWKYRLICLPVFIIKYLYVRFLER